MNARQRGATLLLAVLLAGRALDAFDLPWEQRIDLHADSALQSPVALELAPTPAAQAQTVPAAAASETAETAPTPTQPLNVNEAGERQLQALPGVGPVLAARIVAYRQEHGAFKDMATLRQVKGVGARMVERLAPLLRFE